MKNTKEFTAKNKITSTAEWADSNPHMPDSQNMDHWKVTLRRDRKRLTVYFYMGYAHSGKQPQADDVLDCLASDSAGLENARDFEDWAAEYGYDADSRKAEKIYRVVERQTAKLKGFLGEDLYNELLWETERL